MRNWNVVVFRVLGRWYFGFSAYLWGIETINWTISPSKVASFSAYLWGIETSSAAVPSRGLGCVFSLPMRNWNRLRKGNLPRNMRFSAYLWGIETPLFSTSLSSLLGFQPTYEELKLRLFLYTSAIPSVFSLPMRNWNQYLHGNFGSLPGFQPTYEELKPICCRFSDTSLLCFQPTYEELKLAEASRLDVLNRVFSLPMRNWNLVSGAALPLVVIQFSAYLWGIETIFKVN